jgi:hypothetical protein
MLNITLLTLLIAIAIQNLTLTDIDSVVSIVKGIVEIIARIIEIFLLFKKS